jgi:polygalacturonase
VQAPTPVDILLFSLTTKLRSAAEERPDFMLHVVIALKGRSVPASNLSRRLFPRILAALLLALLPPGLVRAQNPQLPTIPANTFYITNFSAVGDGVTTNTTAIQNAINAAKTAGGGTVHVTTGVFLCGPITLANNLNLQLDTGATLVMLPMTKWPGGDVSPPDFITASSLHDLEISGSGVMDGQGLPWWKDVETNSGASRPVMVNLSTCSKILIQDITMSNSPSPFFSIKGKAGNVTMQRAHIYAPSSGANPASHNTDALDLAETNAVMRDCIISTGDDNLAVGSSASASSDILVTNCTFGDGHGVSIGSFTSGGVSNMTVINCTFNNTDQGIRIKSDRDRGGLVQNISYLNLGMTNVMYPILIYATYTNTDPIFHNLNNLTPAQVSAYPFSPVTSKTPIYRNITISNVTGTAQSGRMAGMIWGLPEMAVSNLVMIKVTISGSKTFGIYDTRGTKLVDSQINTPTGNANVSFYNAGIVFTNSTPSSTPVSLDGATTNSNGNSLSFYNAKATLQNTNALAVNPVITTAASTFTVNNNFSIPGSAQFNFVLGTNAATVAVANDLVVNGTFNISAGAGFTNGSYTLLTYGGNLNWGAPVFGTLPPGFNYAFDTNTTGVVNLLVEPPPPSAPANLTADAGISSVNLNWLASANATGYNVQRGTNDGGPYTVIAPDISTTNYTDAAVVNGTTYFYVVSAINGGGESPDSPQASATPTPSLAPVSLQVQVNTAQLSFTWPADHTGWHLQMQTNDASTGLNSNWIDVPGSDATNAWVIPVDTANDSAFFRLVYP